MITTTSIPNATPVSTTTSTTKLATTSTYKYAMYYNIIYMPKFSKYNNESPQNALPVTAFMVE